MLQFFIKPHFGPAFVLKNPKQEFSSTNFIQFSALIVLNIYVKNQKIQCIDLLQNLKIKKNKTF